MTQKNKKSILGIATVSAVLLMLMLCITPVSATDTFSSYKQIYVPVGNDAGARFDHFGNETYYYIFTKSGGGLNSIHISDNYSDYEGDVYSNKGNSGTFYITDTSTDTQYHDDAILMFAVPNSDYLNNEFMSLTVTTSGYQWTPTGDGLKPSNPGSYQANYFSETFDTSDFLGGTSSWRPSSLSNYPVYNNQNVSAGEEFKFIFIDLNLGTLNDTAQSLTNYGAVKVDYTISDYNGDAVFDAYAYCNQSKRGQGVSWTNKLSDILGGNSCWTIDF
ncbi:hypothetical protein [Methanoplanus limicola]|uniref:PKD domain containing protein n=1 Tax=Methanoplanus limicola DSM 2279 TaxID=937775 RepID=H1YY07_9EURY|nr:hypothetical protein [Methanoplanus limicola]EHQ36942.1 PKD domain containing protein [Methanoplanus limicola DSM 2279]